MKTQILVAVLSIMGSLPRTASSQAPVIIDFDDLSAPCSLGSAQPLRNEYAALGVVFTAYPDDGGAAVLDECSGYGVAGYSPPNFAVFDREAQLATGGVPDALRFSFTGDAPHLVRVAVGGPPGAEVFLECTICPWSIPGCDRWDSVVLDEGMRTLVVSADDPFREGCSVHAGSLVRGTWVVDDLELNYQAPGSPVPSLSPVGVAIFASVIAVLGMGLVRRVAVQ